MRSVISLVALLGVGASVDGASRTPVAEAAQTKDAKSAEMEQANESGVNVSAFGKVVDAKGSPVASAAV